MKHPSIRTQITALTLIPLLVILISMEGLFLHTRFSDMDEDLVEHGKLTTHLLAGSAEYGIFSNNTDFLQSLANNILAQQKDVKNISFLDSQGKLILHSGNAPISSNQNKLDALRQRSVSGSLNSVLVESGSIWITHPIVSTQIPLELIDQSTNSKQIGYVILEMSRNATEARKSEILWFTVLTSVLILVLPLYAIFLTSRNITKPIRTLSEAVLRIAAGHFDTRVSDNISDTREIIHLTKGINEMAKQIQTDREVLELRIEEATCALREKKEEAERSSHDKSHFLAVASHDLRQPLHALGLYIAELQRKVSSDDQKYLVNQVERSVENLSTLLNALLDISKLDAGAIIPQIQIVDVNQMLNRVSSDYLVLAGMRNIRLVVRSCNAHVRSDPVLLERILMNLVSNALRYTPQNGCVMIACRLRQGRLKIEVRDNGIGISAADQEHIFREFFQLNQPQLDSSKGLGLGLAIVDRLAKLLNHPIGLTSAVGKGSVFSISVPLVQGSFSPLPIETTLTEIDEQKPDSTDPLSGKNLLIVDDDEMVLQSTASILGAWGCKVTLASSLADVATKLSNGVSWDMVISDYQLAGDTTGIDVINLIRGHSGQSIPCILISGDTGPAVIKLATVSGYQLLHKPVKPAKLRSLLLHLLDQPA